MPPVYLQCGYFSYTGTCPWIQFIQFHLDVILAQFHLDRVHLIWTGTLIAIFLRPSSSEPIFLQHHIMPMILHKAQ